MDEHDDDLESQVQKDAEREVNAFPDTGDQLDELIEGALIEETDDIPLDEDKAEL
jgi:hypothetical protein